MAADPRTQATDPETPVVRRRPGAVRWVREHLIGTWYDALFTVAFGALFAWAGIALVRWLIGSDFTIIRRNLTLFIVGRYPREELWRLWIAAALLSVMVGLIAGLLMASARDRAEHSGLPHVATRPRGWLRRFWPILVMLAAILAFTETILPTVLTLGTIGLGVGAVYLGRALPARVRRNGWIAVVTLLLGAYVAIAGFGGVGWDRWSGFHLTVFLTVGGILFAFPIGLLAAVGRRSALPGVRIVAVTYIEFVRGVPLITLLFMGIFALGFMLPDFFDPGDVTRVLVAIALFEGAYIAEIVRGGLQGVPPGQVEAAQALGLRRTTILRRIVLPQALRNTIPALVGQNISLYKDTSLVAFIGLIELLRVSNIANSQPAFVGRSLAEVTLPFVGLIYWVVSYTMSREGRRLERRLGVGTR